MGVATGTLNAQEAFIQGRILLTGRTDNFLQGRPDLDDTIRRLLAGLGANARRN